MESRIFLTAVELGVFPAIGKESRTAEELAVIMGADRRALGILLNALAAQGLLAKDGERFANIPGLAELLVPRRPAGNTGFEHAVDVWRAWSELSSVVVRGRPAERSGRLDASRECATMDLYSQVQAAPLVGLLDCSTVGRLLDLGGGTGVYALEMARRHPQLRAVIFDVNEAALGVARQRIAEHGLHDRVCVQHGDFLRDDIGGAYDMVLLSSVISVLGEEDNLLLLRRVCEAMNPAGRLAICDAMLNGSGTSPRASAVFSVHLLVTTRQGRVYTHEQVCRWLRSAGLRDIQRVPLGNGCVITARK
jgi:predicted O-methyltransferase YrrM